jgi:hypothetical protein
MSDIEIAEQTHKLLVFADLAGHQKYCRDSSAVNPIYVWSLYPPREAYR